jgi:hypothetical protein
MSFLPFLLGTGEAPGTHPTQGIIDEVWIFNRTVPESEARTCSGLFPQQVEASVRKYLKNQGG